jgi:predicted esterase
MHHPLSQLIYQKIQVDRESPRIITLHGYNQFGRDVAAYGLAAAPEGRVISLESYKGVFSWKTITGYTWFVGPESRPSPLFFGDALAEIERFLWDEVDRQHEGQDEPQRAELPFLVGVDQGAIMALATAAAVPDLLSGVIAVSGTLPVVPGWSPPLAPLDGLPVLVLDPPTGPDPVEGVLAGETLAETFTAWGATVTRTTVPAGAIPAETMRTWIAAQPARFRE